MTKDQMKLLEQRQRRLAKEAVHKEQARLRREEEAAALNAERLAMKARLAGKDRTDPELSALMGVLRTAKVAPTFQDLCNVLDKSPVRVQVIIDRANRQGYSVAITGERVVSAPPAQQDAPARVAVAGKVRSLAVVGDIHFGSKYHCGDYFQDFCKQAYKSGVREFLQVGDILDGNYKHGRFELTAHGFDDQAAMAVKNLPHWPDARWHFIQGNHDETLSDNGMDVGRALEQAFRAAGREDVHYVGNRGGYVQLVRDDEERGLAVHLWHPRKGGAYALSYGLQKQIEKYSPGQKPDLLCAGHWHQSNYFQIRGVHAISAGCWQGGGSSFSKSLGGAPSIGSWIVKYALTVDGTVRKFQPEWIPYFEKETVRKVLLT